MSLPADEQTEILTYFENYAFKLKSIILFGQF